MISYEVSISLVIIPVIAMAGSLNFTVFFYYLCYVFSGRVWKYDYDVFN
jgi:NADH:ubiquinone oxidoreductase subunit H